MEITRRRELHRPGEDFTRVEDDATPAGTRWQGKRKFRRLRSATFEPGATLRIRVNGTEHDIAAAPDTPLLYVLHNELSLNGPKYGCGVGQCGSCTVHVDGVPRRSCNTALSEVAGKSVTTLEGLGTPERPHPLQQAFIHEQAAQCGYCANGMIMRAAALLARTPRPTRDEINSALSANLCRCGTHMRIVRAVERGAAAASSKE